MHRARHSVKKLRANHGREITESREVFAFSPHWHSYLPGLDTVEHEMMYTRRSIAKWLAFAGPASAIYALSPWHTKARAGHLPAEGWANRLIAEAAKQIGETVTYDPSYVGLDYPGGDVPRDRGVCTDVVIRAYRDAFDIDLQKLVHEDMKRHFASYPAIWGLTRPDRNIDHRRVPNLERFFSRAGASLEASSDPAAFKPGDLVSQRLPGNLPHISIVSDRLAGDGITPLVIHNIGAGTRMENRLFAFGHTGHFRYPPELA